MSAPRIVELLNNNHYITDVSVSEIKSEKDGFQRTEGFLKINGLKGKFIFNETHIMDINTIGIIFEYSLSKKAKKELIYEVMDYFNNTKTGLKATLKRFTKGMTLSISFTIEIVSPPKSEFLSETLDIMIPILSAAPLIFGGDLNRKGIVHKSITEN